MSEYRRFTSKRMHNPPSQAALASLSDSVIPSVSCQVLHSISSNETLSLATSTATLPRWFLVTLRTPRPGSGGVENRIHVALCMLFS